MKRLFRIRQSAKMLVQHLLLPAAYLIECRKPVKKGRIVFADAHHGSTPESMAQLVRAARQPEAGFEVVEWYRDFGRMGALRQLRESAAFMKLYATAQTVVICDNFLPVSSCRKRRGTTVVQLWHGPGAFKRFGYDAPEDIPSYYKGHVYRNYDLVTVSGTACVGPFAGAMRLPKKVVQPVGVCRMDACLSEAWRQECREEFRRLYPEARGRKVLLWAPTFRGNAGAPEAAGIPEMERLAKALSDEWLVVMSLHPHLRRTITDERYFGRMPSERMLPAADLFVTDYSSLLYDACLQRRRVLIFAPDLEEFERGRGTYMPLSDFPGIIVRRGENLAPAVEQTMAAYDFQKQQKFVQNWLGACDGHATERVLHFIRERAGEK